MRCFSDLGLGHVQGPLPDIARTTTTTTTEDREVGQGHEREGQGHSLENDHTGGTVGVEMHAEMTGMPWIPVPEIKLSLFALYV